MTAWKRKPSSSTLGASQIGFKGLSPTLGSARGTRDKVTPAQVEFRGEEEWEEGLNWRRELNLRQTQITEVANLKAYPEPPMPQPSLIQG